MMQYTMCVFTLYGVCLLFPANVVYVRYDGYKGLY